MTAFAASWREAQQGAFGARTMSPAVWRDASAGLDLIRPGLLFPPLALTRAQAAGAVATTLAADGATWQQVGGDVPRFHAAPRRLMIGGQRTNQNTNPRAENAIPGTPGTRPTGWPAFPVGVTYEIIGNDTRNGVQGLVVRLHNVPTVTSGQFLTIGGAAETVAAGTVVSNSVFIEVLAGSLTNLTGFDFRASNTESGTSFTPGSFQRVTNTRTLVGTSSGTVIRYNHIDTVTPVNCTLFVGWPQREHAPFVSSPILPPVNTPGAATRGADLITASLASLGIAANGACTVLGTAMLPQAASSAAGQVLIHVDDGTPDNRYLLRNAAGGSSMQVLRATAGAVLTATAGAMTPGASVRFGVTISAAGDIRASIDGGAVAGVAGGPTGGLTTFRAGSDTTGAQNLFGEIAHLRVLPAAVSDTELERLVAGMPT